jgi:hypothetical protein
VIVHAAVDSLVQVVGHVLHAMLVISALVDPLRYLARSTLTVPPDLRLQLHVQIMQCRPQEVMHSVIAYAHQVTKDQMVAHAMTVYPGVFVPVVVIPIAHAPLVVTVSAVWQELCFVRFTRRHLLEVLPLLHVFAHLATSVPVVAHVIHVQATTSAQVVPRWPHVV